MKLKDYLLEIEKFVKDYLQDNHMDKYILGLSGGVDSSLVAAITRNAVGKDRLLCVAIPIDSNEDDLKDAIKVSEELDLNLLIVDQSQAYHTVVDGLATSGIYLDRSTLSNLKVRIRMCVLYAIAQKQKGLVLGTDNADERYTGYFTKYGDGAADLLPIGHLLKREVIEASKIYGLSKNLAERVPTAGLFEGQTDEMEMGVKYNDLDDFLLGKKIDNTSLERIERLHKISEHKRVPIPMPIEFHRD